MRRPLLAHVLAVVALTGIVLQVVFGAATENELSWGLPILVFTVITLGVGWSISWRQPTITLGWLLLVIALLFATQGVAAFFGAALAPSAPDVARWLLWWGGDNQWSWLPPLVLLVTQLPLRFPDGRLPSPRWRWLSWASFAVLVLSSAVGMTEGESVGSSLANPTFVDFGSATSAIDLIGVAVLIPVLFGSIAALFVRYRRGSLRERAQLRWMFWAVALAVGILVLGWSTEAVLGDESSGGLGAGISFAILYGAGFGYSLIPLSILFAVLRRGLYSIDRIISRTAAYAIVTLGTLAVYAGALLLVSLVFSGLPQIGVAIATLAAAAVFLPLLRSVRRIVDRRFDREQYDARAVVERFGQRVRNGAHPHTAGVDLLGAVEQTLQPAALGIWVRGDER
jgi:hypothetical protein